MNNMFNIYSPQICMTCIHKDLQCINIEKKFIYGCKIGHTVRKTGHCKGYSNETAYLKKLEEQVAKLNKLKQRIQDDIKMLNSHDSKNLSENANIAFQLKVSESYLNEIEDIKTELPQEEIIKYYERNLEKVKQMHNPLNCTNDLDRDKCNSFIKFAEEELEAAKKGRKW